MDENITLSTEVMLYPMFYRTMVQRKLFDFNRLWSRSQLSELPRSCVLHLIDDNFLLNKPITFVPDDDNWTMLLKPGLKFISHVTQPVQGVIPFKETFLLPERKLIPTIFNYRKKTLKWIRPWKNIEKMPPILNSQAVISYLSLYRARIFGMLKATRRFNYIFTSVLNNICKQPNQVHFVPIPVGNTEYSRSDFVQSFKGYTKAAIRYPDDPWYQFCMHLLGFMHTGTESLFSKIPGNVLKNINFILYTNSNILIINLKNLLDFNGGKKDVVLIRFIKQLNDLALTGQALSFTDFGNKEPAADDETEETDNISESDLNDDNLEQKIVIKQVEKKNLLGARLNIKPVETIDDLYIRPKQEPPKVDSYRFSRLNGTGQYSKIIDRYKRFIYDNNLIGMCRAEDTSRLTIMKNINKLIEEYKTPEAVSPLKRDPIEILHQVPDPVEKRPDIKVVPRAAMPKLVKSDAVEEIEMPEIPVFDEIDSKIMTIQPKTVNNGKDIVNAPAYTGNKSKEDQKKFDESETEEIDAKASEAIALRTDLTTAQVNHAVKLSNAYKEIKFENKTLKEIIDSSPKDSISSSELDFLKDQVPDQSMLKSSINNFDTDYINNYFKRDLIMEMTSFNRCGMFLKDFKMEDISDAMNNMYMVTAKYEDLNHKQHTVKFTVPKVDNRGYCYINGGLKILKKQRITNPICKVSPVRVTLSSDYNKYLVERVTTVAHSFINYIDKIVETANKSIEVAFGTADLPKQTYPYEFTAISKKYTSMMVANADDYKNKWYFYFNRPDLIEEFFTGFDFAKKDVKDALENESEVKGYLIGMHNKENPEYVYMKLDGSIVIYNSADDVTRKGITFIDLLCEICNLDISHLSEWTEFKLLSKSVPTIFALAYRYGLSHMLNYTKCKYNIYDKKARYPRKQSDVIIKFKDKVLVVPRAPLAQSLLFAGLNNYDLSKYNIEEMDSKDVYFDLLQSKKMSVHNLKGIDNYFDLFVDPITKDVLHRMGEPTDAKDLLIRATTLLTTEDHPPVAASTNYRFRSYERICTAVYKVLANTYGTYRYRGIGAGNTFSIKDFEITNMVMNDQLMEPVDQINPINDVIYREEYGHGGAGGRQSTDTFMVDDRQWPADGVGIIGESSCDNGKTGYAGNMSNNPTVDNIRGLTISKDVKDIEPSEAFTSTSLLGPCVTQDDSKRASFFHVHMSHYVATKDMTLPRVRTGYERVVAHRCRLPFTYAAEENGIIEKIDVDSHMLIISYPGSNRRVAVEYGQQYTSNGGGGFWCTQDIVINGFKEGDKVKRGDIIIYNERFFKADPFSKQIDIGLGVLANVAFIDTAQTVEDSSIISKSLADKLEFNPVHPRDIIITKQTNIHKYAAIGTKVNNTDPLMIFDQSVITDDMFGKVDDETAALLAKVNRQTPRAKFTGRIVRIDAFYIGDTSTMSQSARNLVNLANRDKNRRANVAKDMDNEAIYHSSSNVKVSTRIGATVLEEDTLIIRFYIQQDMSMNSGDKIEFDSSLKSVCAGSTEEDWETDDHSITVQALFSQLGQNKRLIHSPVLTGMANRCLEKIENDVLDMYFK